MFKLLLIWRYFIRKRIALIAVLAVTLLVMLVLVVLSVMSGLLEMTRQRNHDWAGDIVISRDSLVGFPYYREFIDTVSDMEQIEHITPVISTYALMESDISRTIYGVIPDEFFPLTRFADNLLQTDEAYRGFDLPVIDRLQSDFGYMLEHQNLTDPQRKRGIMEGVYKTEWLNMKENQYIWHDGRLRDYYPIDMTVFAIDSRGVLTGSAAGENQRFWYINSYNTGLTDVDESLMVHFEQIQKLTWMDGSDGNPPRTSQIRIRLRENTRLDTAFREIEQNWRRFIDRHQGLPSIELLNDVRVHTWSQFRRDFIAPMEKERSLMVVVFTLIAVVAVFIIFAIFYMIVAEKIKDLGIIKSLGGSRGALAQIFLGYGLFIGSIGALIGAVLGSLIVCNSNQLEAGINALTTRFLEKTFQIWDPDIYAIERIPDTVDIPQALVIVAVALLACLLGAVIPALRAARLEVVDALRAD